MKFSDFMNKSSTKNAAGEEVKFQNTNLPGEILKYVPRFEGDDVNDKKMKQEKPPVFYFRF